MAALKDLILAGLTISEARLTRELNNNYGSFEQTV